MARSLYSHTQVAQVTADMYQALQSLEYQENEEKFDRSVDGERRHAKAQLGHGASLPFRIRQAEHMRLQRSEEIQRLTDRRTKEVRLKALMDQALVPAPEFAPDEVQQERRTAQMKRALDLFGLPGWLLDREKVNTATR
ncbi:hypothetical protein M8818_005876 [Zalaria obscura]|uniref:Uncharacterized protein n=1 Tax=Zalaria obscura TaxID=2024903 RepID=A0ACC3S7N7_9PEZI